MFRDFSLLCGKTDILHKTCLNMSCVSHVLSTLSFLPISYFASHNSSDSSLMFLHHASRNAARRRSGDWSNDNPFFGVSLAVALKIFVDKRWGLNQSRGSGKRCRDRDARWCQNPNRSDIVGICPPITLSYFEYSLAYFTICNRDRKYYRENIGPGIRTRNIQANETFKQDVEEEEDLAEMKEHLLLQISGQH